MKFEDLGEIDFPIEENFIKNVNIIYNQLLVFQYFTSYINVKKLITKEATEESIEDSYFALHNRAKTIWLHLEFFINIKDGNYDLISFEEKDYLNSFFADFYFHRIKNFQGIEFDINEVLRVMKNPNLIKQVDEDLKNTYKNLKT